MSQLNTLIALCKSGIEIDINPHRLEQPVKSAASYLSELGLLGFYEPITDNDLELYKVMVEKDQIIKIRAYSETSIGYHIAIHHDFEVAVCGLIDEIREDRGIPDALKDRHPVTLDKPDTE